MKKLLRFIIIFTVLFNIYSCETDDDCNGCEKWLCEKDTDCKENEICNSYLKCVLNPCLSMNCGEGICELDELSTAYCKCNEGFYLKDKYKITETCIAMPECHSSEECRIRDNNGVVLHSCITGNICSGLCNNDNDCIGENEYCLINETERICYPISECVESQYFSFATYICESKGCDNSSSECPEGFVCENRECVKTCSSDEDCLNYKWANGDICNSQTLTCGNVQISNLTPKETAEILFKEIGSEESCVDSNEYFYESCNGFEIEYSNMNDLGTERIEIVDTTNNLTERTIETQSEYDNLLNSAKEKTLLFLTTEFPSQTFKLVKSEIVYWDEPCSVGDLCDSIVIVYERTLGGIPLLGYEAYFQFDLNSNYRMISLGYLYITERTVDTALINELENDTVLIQNCDERIRYVSYGYYKITNEFEIVFLFTVQNGIYMISKNEFNSCQAVIDKIDDPYTNHACEAMPCYDPHEDCIPYEESDYYCDCEEGYEYNDDNVCVVSVK